MSQPAAAVLVVRLSAAGEVLDSNVHQLDPSWFSGASAALERALAGRIAELCDLLGSGDGPAAFTWHAGGCSLVTTVRAERPGILATATLDVTDLVGGPGELHRADLLDGLTGLATRAAVIERLTTLVRRAGRDGTVVGVMVVDLDDRRGVSRDAGWGRVTAAGALLSDATRSGDLVGRIGDGEFAVVFGSALGESEARIVADRVLASLGDVHVGLAFTASPRTAAALVDEARAAVSLARSTGASRIFVVDDAARGSLDWSGRRVAELRLALDVGQFHVDYQPIVDLVDGSVRSVEALARWDHPAEGVVAPEEFVPLAERTGLAPMLTEVVLNLVVGRLAADAAQPPIAVNVTAVDLLRDGFPERVEAKARAAGVEPSRLRLELTETAVLADPAHAATVIGRLRHHGIGVALDDFGTGESSLAVLTRLPVDTLKIDQAFVAGLPDSAADLAVARLVVGLGRELGLDVVAEGIETEAQRDVLVAMGCRYGQGFLLGRPSPT